MHLTDEELIQHFYLERHGGDDSRAGRQIARHLETCAVCQETWAELTDTLKLVDEAPVPDPAAGFEQRLWARVQRGLSAVIATEHPAVRSAPRQPARTWFGWLVPAAGVAALIIVTFVALERSANRRTPPLERAPVPAISSPKTAANDSGSARERVLLRAAEDHLEQAEMLLVELMNAPEASHPDLRFERAAADELVFSSRLYRQTAQQNGDVRLAGVLEDLESVFVEVARSPEKINRRDFDSIRARIGGDSLLFKVRAASNEIRERQNRLMVTEGAL